MELEEINLSKLRIDLMSNLMGENYQTQTSINIIGKKKGLPQDIKKTVYFIEKKTLNNKKITLNLALNYGSKEEIINACKALAKGNNSKINFRSFEKKLYVTGTAIAA